MSFLNLCSFDAIDKLYKPIAQTSKLSWRQASPPRYESKSKEKEEMHRRKINEERTKAKEHLKLDIAQIEAEQMATIAITWKLKQLVQKETICENNGGSTQSWSQEPPGLDSNTGPSLSPRPGESIPENNEDEGRFIRMMEAAMCRVFPGLACLAQSAQSLQNLCHQQKQKAAGIQQF
ncbi:hypothetical protein SERLADRAFT_405911 [Serpula lacrymans var. lacrymans S7.9]|nr:uncharacterized protein SERLADRAFT_405911 [Serpula lacrymans var. lacrymans S7.9]EGO28331.1 hypothetical protein SERLADRAFT_405911 [Serpula lacrymans var. lacrymans S7.9]